MENYSEYPTDQWIEDLVHQAAGSQCLTIGLISGHREPNDARCIYRLAGRISHGLNGSRGNGGLLVCRLNIEIPMLPRFRKPVEERVEPEIEKSALGNWHEVEVPMKICQTACWTLQSLPRWLPKWKLRFQMIVVDLGPIHLVPSRTIGRLCDTNYLLLGPNNCASPQWILQYRDYHAYCGSHIDGTVVSSFAA